jgi:hypothetical protein
MLMLGVVSLSPHFADAPMMRYSARGDSSRGVSVEKRFTFRFYRVERENDKRLGHGVVFRYNHKMGVLGMQYEPRVVSPGRFMDYLASFNAKAIYSFAPIIDEQSWAKFAKGKTRKLAIRIANPASLKALDHGGKAASDAIRAMGQAYKAPSVYVELSMGHHKGELGPAIVNLAKQLTQTLVPGADSRLDLLQSMTVIDDESEPIDLIEDRIEIKDVLAIDDRDPEKIYTVKRDYLRQEMKKRVE